jgi:hypothetical protein
MALLFTDHGVLGKFLCLAEPWFAPFQNAWSQNSMCKV